MGPVRQVPPAFQKNLVESLQMRCITLEQYPRYTTQTPSHPVELVVGKQSVHIRDCVKAPCEKSLLDCHQPGHHPFFIQNFCIPVNQILTIYAPLVGIILKWCRDIILV